MAHIRHAKLSGIWSAVMPNLLHLRKVAPSDPSSGNFNAAIVRRLLAEASEALYRDRESARSSLLRATELLNAECAENGVEDIVPSGGLASWQLRRATTFIKENIHRTVSLSELAAHVRLSESYFSRAFKSKTSVSLRNYIQRARVARAKSQMLVTNASLCQIALNCGFSDQPHFCRIFRSVVGHTPAAWRRARMADPTLARSML
jgi:AraC family transcriptional regulator